MSAQQQDEQPRKGVPLAGDLRLIADFSNTFPAATRLFQGEALAFSPLDLAVGGTSLGIAGTAVALGAGPAALIPLAGTLARPLLRKNALSDFVQKGTTKGSTRPSGEAISGEVASAKIRDNR